MAQQYVGVYATHEKAPPLGEFPRPLGMRKRLWFVWELPEGKYKVQALNAALQPMTEPRIIPSKEFSARFVYEPECFAAPEGLVHPNLQGVDLVGASLPDLFLNEPGEDASLLPPPQRIDAPGKMLADDPNLLLAWAKAEPKSKVKTPDPMKMPFDRLVGEVAPQDGDGEEAAGAGLEQTDTGTAGEVVIELRQEAPPPPEEDVQQMRHLRSQFVQALLLLRRGARSEGLTLLEEMLSQPQPFFEGGAQLFSEFGLGLRRLGFMSLALAAHKRALDFAPDDARILFNIARTYHDLDLLPEAREFLGRALAIDPEFAVARQFLMFLEASDTPGNA